MVSAGARRHVSKFWSLNGVFERGLKKVVVAEVGGIIREFAGRIGENQERIFRVTDAPA